MTTASKYGLAAALALGACGTPAAPGPASTATARVPAPAPDDTRPPELRLPDAARPLRYDLDLAIDPAREEFSGAIGIDLELSRAVSALWLNATDLTIDTARLSAGGQVYELRTLAGGDDFAGFALPAPAAAGPGRARLDITYRGELDGERSQGVYREKEGDAWYVYTFFEPIDGRRAFPCFDEPAYKVPWKLTIRAPRGNRAFANAPAVAEHPVQSAQADPGETDMVATEFAESEPLPSYLVAFVVGPFDVVDAGTVGRGAVPLRFLVPRGRGPETAYAAQVTPRIVELLEDFFDMPYPYRKLDVAVVPRFWGTMEHPGIVAMGQPLTLIKPEEATVWRKQGYVNIALHELAHYWFGDYVTMAWWDDTWLNEALASWLADKLTDAFEPKWEFAASRAGARDGAMATDSLPTARKIREPVTTKHEIINSFDGAITYTKGAQVLATFEEWVGPERFRRALRAYLDEFAWANADAAGFLRVMRRELEPAVGPNFDAAFATFLDQPGFPLVSVDLDCAAEPTLVISQKHFVPAGVAPTDRQWMVPVCLKYGFKTAESRTCVLLNAPAARVPIEGGRCPDWVMANAGGGGYYRTAYTEPLARALLAVERDRLTLPERIAAYADLVALAQTGEVAAETLLAMVPGLVKEGNRHLISRASGIVSMARELAPDELAPNLGRFVRSVYGPQARALGWRPRPGEDERTTRLRPQILGLATVAGQDAKLRREAVDLARKYLRDRKAVDPSMASSVLFLAAQVGDQALFDAYLAEAQEQTDHRERGRFFAPLGAFPDPALLERALALLLDDAMDIRDVTGILWVASGHDRHPEVAYAFVRDNFDALVARMRSDEAAALGNVVSQLCDDAAIASAERELGARFAAFDGGPREIANALDRARACAALERVQQPSVAAFLRKW